MIYDTGYNISFRGSSMHHISTRVESCTTVVYGSRIPHSYRAILYITRPQGSIVHHIPPGQYCTLHLCNFFTCLIIQCNLWDLTLFYLFFVILCNFIKLLFVSWHALFKIKKRMIISMIWLRIWMLFDILNFWIAGRKWHTCTWTCTFTCTYMCAFWSGNKLCWGNPNLINCAQTVWNPTS